MSIGYVAVRYIPCSCLECLNKLSPPWNISLDKYNQDRYKFDNQNFVYWPILRSLKNWQIIHCIASRKQHESSDTEKCLYKTA